MKKFYLVLVTLYCITSASAQTTTTIIADRDNTIYSAFTGNSNGAGQYLFVGKNAAANQGSVQRALLHFDLSAIPAGAVITAATLTVNVNKTAPGATGVTLLKMTADWGEGTSDADGREASGVAATANDATWLQRKAPSTSWSSTGGDFSPTVSASVASISAGLGSLTPITFTGSNVIADVQQWVTNSSTNFGWIIMSNNEGVDASVKRIISRNNTTNQPVLSISFSVNLPVKLKSFAGVINNNAAMLQWKTATEINNSHFEVERSTNGITFSSVGRVNGNGTSNIERSYSFTDRSLSSGNHYYRLAQYDFDGGVHYSSSITLAAKSTGLFVTPNPASVFIKVVSSTAVEGAAYFITSNSGQTVKKGIISRQQIDVQGLAGGQYRLTIVDSKGAITGTTFLKK